MKAYRLQYPKTRSPVRHATFAVLFIVSASLGSGLGADRPYPAPRIWDDAKLKDWALPLANGAPVPFYERFIEQANAEPDSVKKETYKKYLIPSYRYLVSNSITKKDDAKAKEYAAKILAIDPNDKDAKEYLEGAKTPTSTGTTPVRGGTPRGVTPAKGTTPVKGTTPKKGPAK